MATSNESCPKLLSLAVHELRSPLSIVAGYLGMLQRDTESPLSQRQRKMVEEASKSCQRLAILIKEMSEVSNMDAGDLTFAKQPLEVFSLVQEVADGVHEAEDREVRLEVGGQPVPAPMTGDSARLRTAFQAIFRAILREQPNACSVVVDWRLEQRGGAASAVIVVAEAGVVQAAYESPAGPFDEFDEKRGGMGLALPIARRVIERHGGQLSALAAPVGADDQINGRGVAIVSLPLRS